MLASRRFYGPAFNLIGPGCVAEVGAEVAGFSMGVCMRSVKRYWVVGGLWGLARVQQVERWCESLIMIDGRPACLGQLPTPGSG